MKAIFIQLVREHILVANSVGVLGMESFTQWLIFYTTKKYNELTVSAFLIVSIGPEKKY